MHQPGWYALWSIFAGLITVAEAMNDLNSQYMLSIWVITTHAYGFAVCALAAGCFPRHPLAEVIISSVTGTLWVLSTFVIGGVVIIGSSSVNLVNSSLGTATLGSELIMQVLVHLAPLVALLCLVWVPQYTVMFSCSLSAALYIAFYQMTLAVFNIDFLQVYQQPETGLWYLSTIAMLVWFIATVVLWEWLFTLYRQKTLPDPAK